MDNIIRQPNDSDILQMFQKDEEDEKEAQETACDRYCSKVIIRNSSKARFYWDVFIILFVIYNTFSVPFDAAFGNEEKKLVSMSWVNNVIDVFFCIDVLISFRTSYFDQEGEEVLNGKKIARYYINSGRFFVDFIGSVPIDTFLSLFVGDQSYLDLISLIKLVRVSRINRLISMTKLKTEFKISLRIFQLLFFLILIVHLVACFWHLLVRDNTDWMPPKDSLRGETDVHDDAKMLS